MPQQKTLFRLIAWLLSWSVLCVATGFAQSSTITGTVSTFSGPPLPADGANAITQVLNYPASTVPDFIGGFYVSSASDNRVYHVDFSGVLTVIAGTGTEGYAGDGGQATAAELNHPWGIALAVSGNLFIADEGNNRIRQVTPQGIISTVAGSGANGFSGDNGLATSAQLNFPHGIAVDSVGNLFIADTGNNRIRRVAVAGVITTVAGNGTYGFFGDNLPPTSTPISAPMSVAVDSQGDFYIADTGANRIRKVSSGKISTVVGNGTAGFSGDGGPAISASLSGMVWGVALDSVGNLFIADTGANRIRKVTSGRIDTVAGNGSPLFSGDGALAVVAGMNPVSVSVDGSGNLFISDFYNYRIRKVTSAGVISTVGGNGTAGFSGDGGNALSAQFNRPTAMAFDSVGNLLIADQSNNRVRKITPDGVITTVAGNGTRGFSGDGGPATSAELNLPVGVAIDGADNLFISDSGNSRVRKVTPAGTISTVAGNGTIGFSGDGGAATSASFNSLGGIAVDAAGSLFIADANNNRVRKVTTAGIISTAAGNGGRGFSGDGGAAISASLNAPQSVTFDAMGNLLIGDSGYRIRKVTLSGVISTFAGNGAFGYSGDGLPAISAQISTPIGLAFDAVGNLFIADYFNYRIRQITLDGVMTTLAGAGDASTGAPIRGLSGDDGPAKGAVFNDPGGVAVDAAGNVYIADTDNHRIRKVNFSEQAPYKFFDRGVSLLTSAAPYRAVAGYAAIQPSAGAVTPAGLAIFGYRQNNILVTEATVPASGLIQSGRIYAAVNASVNTGLAIANPNNEPAVVSFYFTDANGNFGSGNITVPPNGQMAKFLNEVPFNAPSLLSGSFTFSSSDPIAVVALRGRTNERGEFLITTLPVADLSTITTTTPIVFPHFADGGGWTTQVVLVNPTDGVLTGNVQFRDASGQSAVVSVNNQISDAFSYSIPARSSVNLKTAGTGTSVTVGSVRVLPSGQTPVPSGLVIFSLQIAGTTVSEAGVPAVSAGSAFRIYAESSGDFTNSSVGSIQTGVAVANTTANPAVVTVELLNFDGLSAVLTGQFSVPANGQKALMLSEIPGLAGAPMPFQGLLRVSSGANISVLGIRARYNERKDILITTVPAANEAIPPSTTALYFPHIASGGGFTTQLILFSSQPGTLSTGTIQLFNQSGGALGVNVQ